MPDLTKQLFNFKEYNNVFGLGWSDFGFRFYLGDSGIPRFLNVDPSSEQFASLSTYNYASNNPTSKIDLHGASMGIKIDRGSVSMGIHGHVDRFAKGFGMDWRIDPDALSRASRWIGESIPMGFQWLRDGLGEFIQMGFEGLRDGLGNRHIYIFIFFILPLSLTSALSLTAERNECRTLALALPCWLVGRRLGMSPPH